MSPHQHRRFVRRLVCLTLLLYAYLCCIGVAAQTDDDTTLLDTQATSSLTQQSQSQQSAAVSALESQLNEALQQQHQLEKELQSQQQQESASSSSDESTPTPTTSSFNEVHSDAHSHSAAQIEAEFEAEAAAEMENESESDSEAEHESQTESHTETDENAEMETDEGMENENEHEQESETESESDSESESEESSSSDDFAPTKSLSELDSTHSTSAPSDSKDSKSSKSSSATKEDKPKPKLKVTRTDPNSSPDVAILPDGTKLTKSWVVNPNIQFKTKKKPVPKRHSQEREMTPKEQKKFTRIAKVKRSRKQKASDVRRAFLRMNPEQKKKVVEAEKKKAKAAAPTTTNGKVEADTLDRSFSPTSSLSSAFRAGKFPQLQFDPPTSTSITVVHQNVIVKQHSPSARARAGRSALRSATRTLRRINSKRREYQSALDALSSAKATLQEQIHAHHVQRAVEARAVAKKAQRRAAWSSILQHSRLKHELLDEIASVIRREKLTGEARRAVIKKMLHDNISSSQRSKLHQFIRDGSWRRRHHGRRRGCSRAEKRRRERQQKKLKQLKKELRKAKAAAKKAAQKTTPITSATGQPKKAQISEKDQQAINALILRIQAAIGTNHRPAAAAAAPQKKSVASTAKKLRLKQKKHEKQNKHRKQQQKKSKAEKIASHRFAQLLSAETAANEASTEALSELNLDSEIDSTKDAPLLQVQARVEAVTEGTDEFLNHLEDAN